MRRLIIAGTAAVLLTAGPALACEYNTTEADAPQVAAMPIVSVELSAAADKDKKPVKKKVAKKQPKVEYMRAAPM